MIKNTATIKPGAIELKMFSLTEGKEVEVNHPYDALM